jgi:hypothetical protein
MNATAAKSLTNHSPTLCTESSFNGKQTVYLSVEERTRPTSSTTEIQTRKAFVYCINMVGSHLCIHLWWRIYHPSAEDMGMTMKRRANPMSKNNQYTVFSTENSKKLNVLKSKEKPNAILH